MPAEARSKKKQVNRQTSAATAFGKALVAAEKRLGQAIDERNFHAQKYHELNAEIPQLERVVQALRGQQTTIQPPHYPRQGQYAPPAPNYSLEQVMSDAPIPVAQPQQPYIPEPQPANPPHPRPAAHPMAGGGAIGLQIEETEDEDKFLKNTGLPGGEWQG